MVKSLDAETKDKLRKAISEINSNLQEINDIEYIKKRCGRQYRMWDNFYKNAEKKYF